MPKLLRVRKKSRVPDPNQTRCDLEGDEESLLVPEVLRIRKPRKKRKGPEARLLSECLAYLHAKGVFCWRNNSGGTKINGRFMRFGMAGSPDIIGIVNGRFFAVETKAPGGKLSDSQREWHARAAVAGCVVFVVRSIEELMECI